MACLSSTCLGNYDFERISNIAIQRYVEGHTTIEMLIEAKTVQEIEEICLVCLLDVDDTKIQELELSCQNRDDCDVTSCRKQLREMIEFKLKAKNIIYPSKEVNN